MYRCPICNAEYSEPKLCKRCGFDASTDIKGFPTLMDQIDGMNFVKQFVKQWEKVKWEDLDDRDPEKIELIIQWAYHGDISACYQLGTHYLSGEMVRHNAGRAIFWLEKAAEQGNFLAQLKLGIVFFSNNQKTDVEKATHWMRCARRQASSEEEIDAVGQAYYDAAAYGELVEYAYNMEKKTNKICQLVYQCAMHQNVKQEMIAACLDANQLVELGRIWHDKGECTIAQSYMEEASRHKNHDANYYLGQWFFSGDGINIDWRCAIEYLLDSAEHGNENAKKLLLSEEAQKVYSEFKSFDNTLYKLADVLNNQYAQYLVGQFYWTGNGVDRSKTKAFDWFIKAAKQNHCDAQLATAICFYLGEGTEKMRKWPASGLRRRLKVAM